MGLSMAKLIHKSKVDVLMFGLKDVGKTTLLYKLLEKKNYKSVPTFGFNMEVLPFADLDLDVMDVGGDPKIVPLWKHYLLDAGALIYVIDDDVTQMNKNRELLSDMLSWPERKLIPLLIIFNKTGQNRKQTLYVEDVIEQLSLQQTCKNRNYKVQFVAHDSYSGLNEAITWLCSTLGSSSAAKKLKRLRAKQAKKTRKIRYKKRRKNKAKDVPPPGFEINKEQEQQKLVNEAPPIHPALSNQLRSRKKSQTKSSNPKYNVESGVEKKSFVYEESFQRIDSFFKSHEERKIKPRERFLSNNVNDNVTPNIIDTISTDPFSPISPRRPGTLVRLNEFMEKRKLSKEQTKNNVKSSEPLTPSRFAKVLKFFQPRLSPVIDANQQVDSRANNADENLAIVEEENDIKLSTATTGESQNVLLDDKIDSENIVTNTQEFKKLSINQNKEEEIRKINLQPNDIFPNQCNNTHESSIVVDHLKHTQTTLSEKISKDSVTKIDSPQPETSATEQVQNNFNLIHNHEKKLSRKTPPRKISQHDIHVNTALLNRVPGATKNEQRSNERQNAKKKENEVALTKKKPNLRKRRKRKKPTTLPNGNSVLSPSSTNVSQVSPVKVSVHSIIAALRFGGGKRDIDSSGNESYQSTSNYKVKTSNASTPNPIVQVETPSPKHRLHNDHIGTNFEVGESFA